MRQALLWLQIWGREFLFVCILIGMLIGCVPSDQITSAPPEFFELAARQKTGPNLETEPELANARSRLDRSEQGLSQTFDLAAGSVAESQPPLKMIDSLVVCPPELQPSLANWIEYRTAQGHGILVIPPVAQAQELRHQIRQLGLQIADAGGTLNFLFLVGPAGERMSLGGGVFDARQRRWEWANLGVDPPQPQFGLLPGSFIPLHYLPAVVNSKFGSEPELATDILYADLNDDGLPDLSLGRIPFADPTTVQDYLERVIRYESNLGAAGAASQQWRQRINFIAGVGGFGGLVDQLLEQVTKSILTDLIPPAYQTSMTMASWSSPYCPDPRGFCQTTLERFNEGCLFWVYIGHGAPSRLDRIRLPSGDLPILDIESATQINCIQGNPIAIFLSCYNGAIDHRQPCLAEVMLSQPQGAIATISGTRVTMPYAMSLLSLELIDEYFSGDTKTLGELMKLAKRRLMANHGGSPTDAISETSSEFLPSTGIGFIRQMIQGVGKVASPAPDLLQEECWEHLQMMQLYGDPLLRLDRPEQVPIESMASVRAGHELTVTGTAPFAGQLCVELAYPRDRFKTRLKSRRQYTHSDADLANYQQVYAQANDSIWEVCYASIEAGEFSVRLPIPDAVHGKCIIRCRLGSPHRFALGANFVEVLGVCSDTPNE